MRKTETSVCLINYIIHIFSSNSRHFVLAKYLVELCESFWNNLKGVWEFVEMVCIYLRINFTEELNLDGGVDKRKDLHRLASQIDIQKASKASRLQEIENGSIGKLKMEQLRLKSEKRNRSKSSPFESSLIKIR